MSGCVSLFKAGGNDLFAHSRIDHGCHLASLYGAGILASVCQYLCGFSQYWIELCIDFRKMGSTGAWGHRSCDCYGGSPGGESPYNDHCPWDGICQKTKETAFSTEAYQDEWWEVSGYVASDFGQ